jgi:hypothetical protein
VWIHFRKTGARRREVRKYGCTFARAEDDGLSRDRVKIQQNFIRDVVMRFFSRKILGARAVYKKIEDVQHTNIPR